MTPTVITFPTASVQADAASFLTEKLDLALNDGPVFLLISGGSAIAMYDELLTQLLQRRSSLDTLTVSMFDERFGLPQHIDSNEFQLEKMGLLARLQQAGATWVPYLTTTTTTGEATAVEVNEKFATVLAAKPHLIIFAGLGDDGHTAGLLPAADPTVSKHLFESQTWVVYYDVPSDSDNPFRHRITATPQLIAQADEVYVYATGEKKRAALEKVLANTDPVNQCPAISLNQAKTPCTVLTDISISTTS